MAAGKDSLKTTGEDQMRDGTITGSASKGYAELAADGSSYNKYGNRADLNKLANHLFRQMATTIIQKTGTAGTAVMQKAYSGYTYVSQGTSAPGTTAISQKAIANYTQVKGHQVPASLNLTPVTAGSLTLEPFAPLGGESYLLQETGDKILLEDNSGFLIIEESGTGLTLTPISPGSLTLTPITQGSAQIADKKISQLTSGSPAQSGDLIPIDRSGSTESISVNDIKTFVGGSFAGVRVYRSTTQSIPNNAYTAISFDTEEFDTDGYHDLVTNPNRLTVPTGKGGYYLISAVLVFANNGTGQRLAIPRINGSDFLAATSEPNPGGSWAAHMNVSTIFHLSDGDYIELMGYQNSGGNLNAITPGNPGHYCPMLGMARLG